MPQISQASVTLILLSTFLSLGSAACSHVSLVDDPNLNTVQASVTPATHAAAPGPAQIAKHGAALPPAQTAQPDPYPLAIARASSAFTIGQSAQSQDDWRLVASRWQQAITLMTSVPAASPHRPLAQSKLPEYQRNLAYAQQQANRSTASFNPDGVVVISRQQAQPDDSSGPAIAVAPPPIRSSSLRSSGDGTIQVPIVRRAGGTPVINVTFNGSQGFEMIVDTGASGTLITRPMAMALGVVPIAQASVDTASARSVSFPLGYVRSVQVNNIVARNLLVAVAGPELDVGLLGHDFFGDYDITIRQNVVEFRPQ